MKKQLIIINGPMGVGKSVVAEELSRRLQPSVRLDGDWCWQMNPWTASDENRSMVEANIIFLLRSFLMNSSFRFVIFNWVLQGEETINKILSALEDCDFTAHKFTLMASENTLRSRLESEVASGKREPSAVARSLAYLSFYRDMDTVKVDTSDYTVPETAGKIMEFLAV